MSSKAMEMESQEETPSPSSTELSGIRALPSHDDDDDVDDDDDDSDSNSFLENNNSHEKTSENDENNKNLTTGSNENSNNSISRFNSGNNGGFESGEDEFETPLAGPDEETLEKRLLLGQTNSPISGPSIGSPAFLLGKMDTPRAKVTSIEDDDENEEVDVKGDAGEVVGRSLDVEAPQKSRVSGGDDVAGENVDGGAKEEPKVVDDDDDVGCGGGVASSTQNVSLGLENEEHVSSDLAVVESGDVELSNEKNVEEKKGSEVKSIEETSAIEESTKTNSKTFRVDGVKSNNGGVSVEGSGDGDAIGRKIEQRKDSESIGEKAENSIEKFIPSVEDFIVEKAAPVDSKPSEFVGTHVDNAGDVRLEVEGTDKEVKELSTNVDDLDESITKEAETALSLWENDSSHKEHEPLGEPQVVSGEKKKVQPDNVDDEPQTSGDPDGAASKTPSLEIGVGGEEVSETTRKEEGDNHVHSGSWEARSFDHSERVDRQIITDSSEEEGDSNEEEGESNELFDSAALNALLKAATSAGSDSNTITRTSQDGSSLFSVERPAGLGPSSLRFVRPHSRSNNYCSLTPPGLAGVSDDNLSIEERKKLEHVHQLRVKFLRLVFRLGQRVEDSVATQVLYRLALLSGKTNPVFSVDNAKQTALQLEHEGKGNLDFSLNVLVLGKTGVGKSATINSIFGEEKVKIGAFEPKTSYMHEISGIVNGVKIRVIDVPGLKCSGLEQGFNHKVLASVKKFMKKSPPDVVLYMDRLDSQSRDLNDVPMLKTITGSLGSSIWRSAIVTLTHASCAPPDGFSYEVFVAQRSRIVQHSIGQAVGDYRIMNSSLMNPVALVENHAACRTNCEGQRVLPNGQAWKPQLFLLCYSLKILSEASSILKPQDPFDHRKLFGFHARSPPLPYLLSSLLQPRAHPKLSADQGGDGVDSDIDLDGLSDSDQEEEDEYEYDQLPPFKPLRKTQVAKLTKGQRNAYFEEYDYRVKLLQRKQWREELKKMRDMKKRGKIGGDNYGEIPDDLEGENAPATVQVPLPDMILPPSFDGDNPTYRYRVLEPTSHFLARPVLDTHGWDHDCGYDGVNVEQSLGIAGRYPSQITVQVTKDKREFNVHLDSAVSNKHGEHGSSVVGFDIQTIGRQLAYIVKGESKFKNMKTNKTAAGITFTFLGDSMATGVKVEDHITLSKRLVLVGSTGAVHSHKDAAYGANLEVRLREPDYPIGQDQSSLVLSLMKWRGDLAVGAHLQSQFSVGRSSKMAVRFSLNNKLSGQLIVRTSSSDHLQVALAGLIPLIVSIYRKLRPGVSENYSIY